MKGKQIGFYMYCYHAVTVLSFSRSVSYILICRP